MKTLKLTVAVVCFLAVFALRLHAQSFLTNGLIAYFPFNGNAYDASGNGNNGSNFGNVTYTTDRFGESNGAIALPGTVGFGSGVDVPSLTNMPYFPVTYSVWMLLSNYAPNPTGVSVMDLIGRDECGNTSGGALLIFSDPSSGATNLFKYFNGQTGSIMEMSLPTNQWGHIVVTIDQSGNELFYYNGTNVPTTAPPAPAGTPLDFRIGSSDAGGCNNGTHFVWNGDIDDVRIFNRALSSNEVQQLYDYEAPSCQGQAATAVAVETNGFIVGADVIGGGCGYTNVPMVLIEGGGGSGAAGLAVVSNGFVTGINITNAGSGYTNLPQIYIGDPPAITNQPQSTTVNAYGPAAFNVGATGGGLSYQWAFDGTNIPGSNTVNLAFTNVAQTNLGTYTVTVTNEFGSVTSSAAVLSMFPFLTQPFPGVDTLAGYTNTLTVQAWGSGPLIYQWYDNGVALSGATNASYVIDGIQPSQAGDYTVVVSNAFGGVTNAAAEVVVQPAGVSLGLSPTVTITGVVGYTYEIQRSPNLSDTNAWVTVTNLTLTQPVQIWTDTNIDAQLPANPYQFYRILLSQ